MRRNSSVPARRSHSNATISRETICAPFWRSRASASSRSQRVARTDRVGHHEDLLALRQQIETGVQHAHMRFGAGHDDLLARESRQPREAAFGDAGEVHLFDDAARVQPGHAARRPSAPAPADTALQYGQRYVQLMAETYQPRTVLQHALAVVNGRKQTSLDIDDQQCGCVGLQQHLDGEKIYRVVRFRAVRSTQATVARRNHSVRMCATCPQSFCRNTSDIRRRHLKWMCDACIIDCIVTLPQRRCRNAESEQPKAEGNRHACDLGLLCPSVACASDRRDVRTRLFPRQCIRSAVVFS